MISDNLLLRCWRNAFLPVQKVFRDPFAQQIGIDPALLRHAGDGNAGLQCCFDQSTLTFLVVAAPAITALSNYS
ncbi:hypothetical protein SAMN05421548_1683 [Paraburkholderia lycopersici]|uniref:Uncharacterized protein n=1 Tax=Paraburkholderia lycopersici TaxID=416944 RepID=A0A1G7DLR4_9BURK|nr:hypothetical protein SAMN05421548_1683 [Paraburkholderia lycopersici]